MLYEKRGQSGNLTRQNDGLTRQKRRGERRMHAHHLLRLRKSLGDRFLWIDAYVREWRVDTYVVLLKHVKTEKGNAKWIKKKKKKGSP